MWVLGFGNHAWYKKFCLQFTWIIVLWRRGIDLVVRDLTRLLYHLWFPKPNTHISYSQHLHIVWRQCDIRIGTRYGNQAHYFVPPVSIYSAHVMLLFDARDSNGLSLTANIFWKWTNANIMKIFGQIASHHWVKTKPSLAGNQIRFGGTRFEFACVRVYNKSYRHLHKQNQIWFLRREGLCLVLLCDQNSFGRSKMVLVWPNWLMDHFGTTKTVLVT